MNWSYLELFLTVFVDMCKIQIVIAFLFVFVLLGFTDLQIGSLGAVGFSTVGDAEFICLWILASESVGDAFTAGVRRHGPG